MSGAMRITRTVLCPVALIATAAANWINPPGLESQVTVSHGSRIEAPSKSTALAAPETSGRPAPGSGITVARWEFSPTMPGRPVYLSMTLDGTQAAVDRMQAGPPLTIQVHWVRDNAGTAPGASNLVTDLTIGQAGLAAAFDGEVHRNGYFEWHTWARKDNLSPGAWTVSVTYPDGQPLPCGPEAQPCRFSINVG
jgi:hypothetical protein